MTVEGEHVYRVSLLGALVHNNCPVDDVTLYRAVKPEELADIQTTGQLINRGSAEGKYFSATSEGAASYARQAYYGFGDPPYTLVRTQVPAGSLTSETRAVVDRGVQTVRVAKRNTAWPCARDLALDANTVP